MISMFANASQTAVSWRRAAPHTSSRSGAGGNESSVASAESAVIDLKRSLRAYHGLLRIIHTQGGLRGRGVPHQSPRQLTKARQLPELRAAYLPSIVPYGRHPSRAAYVPSPLLLASARSQRHRRCESGPLRLPIAFVVAALLAPGPPPEANTQDREDASSINGEKLPATTTVVPGTASLPPVARSPRLHVYHMP